ncbi:MAG: HAD hydrolase family protein, partial [Planctomycetia bacterium]|nr:HAD hydrolase family protein [Planctomycetia bacterium]
GRVIFATWRPHEAVVLEVIQQLGMEYQIVFNKRAVMVLPSGVNKATGLAAALEGLGLTDEQVVGIGDAENDHAFLESCAASVAVANAVPSLKEHCDFVTRAADGQGVVELIEHLLADDLQSLSHAATPQRENMNKT